MAIEKDFHVILTLVDSIGIFDSMISNRFILMLICFRRIS